MRKILNVLLMIILLGAVIFGFTACGEDEEDYVSSKASKNATSSSDDDNDIYGVASNAANSADESTVTSMLELAIKDLQTFWFADYYTSDSGTTQTFGEYLEENLQDEIGDDYTVKIKGEITTTSKGNVTIKYKGTTYTYSVTLTSSGMGATVTLYE